jgi:hypothetical protein
MRSMVNGNLQEALHHSSLVFFPFMLQPTKAVFCEAICKYRGFLMCFISSQKANALFLN